MLRCIVGSVIAAGVFATCKAPHHFLHIWGNGEYKPRPGHPDDILNFTNFSPKLISFFKEESAPNLVKVFFTQNLDAGLYENGDVYIWDKHILNNVKLEEVDDEYRNVKKLISNEKIIDVAIVDKIVFGLDHKGNVWQ